MKKEAKVAKEKVERVKVNKGSINIFGIAAISGVAVIIFSIIISLFQNIFASNVRVLSTLSLISAIITLVLEGLFTYGFYALGKKYNNKFLRVISILMIIFLIISFLASIFIISPMSEQLGNKFTQDLQVGIIGSNMTDTQAAGYWQNIFQNNNFMNNMYVLMGLLILGFICIAILSILFGIGLIKLKDRVKYAKVAGILEIVGGATLIIFGLGLLPMLAAFIFQLMILFNESK